MENSDFLQKQHFLLWKFFLMFDDQRKPFMDELVELSCK